MIRDVEERIANERFLLALDMATLDPEKSIRILDRLAAATPFDTPEIQGAVQVLLIVRAAIADDVDLKLPLWADLMNGYSMVFNDAALLVAGYCTCNPLSQKDEYRIREAIGDIKPH